MLFTDIWNAEEFSKMYDNQVKWSKDIGGWLIYNGKHWERDRNNKIKSYAMKFHKKLIDDLRKFSGDDDQKELFARHIKSSGANVKLEAMLDCSKGILSESPESFDSNKELFNCSNGTLSLNPIKFTKFNPHDLLTKISSVEFDQKALCPLWGKFLNEIFLERKDIIDFIQRIVGYSLSASTKEQCLFILYGSGRNGKSIFLDTISKMLGHYAFNCPPNTLIRTNNSGGVPNDIASLKGARMVTASENNENVTLNEALIKQLTGGDKITARFLHKEYFEFTPTFKIFIATNHKPNIRGTDIGIWRRIKMIPFDLKITEENDDRNLGDKLLGELPGIFRWATVGYKEWLMKGLSVPRSIDAATDQYKNEEDDLGQFIQDYCVEDKLGVIPISEFKKRFRDINGYMKSQKIINEYMHRCGINDTRKYIDGIQVRCWAGIRFTSVFEK